MTSTKKKETEVDLLCKVIYKTDFDSVLLFVFNTGSAFRCTRLQLNLSSLETPIAAFRCRRASLALALSGR